LLSLVINHPDHRQRREAPDPVPRHPRPGQGKRRRAGPAFDGLRPRLPDVGQVLCLIHRPQRRPQDRRVQAFADVRPSRRSRQRPHGAAHPRELVQAPRRRPALWPDGYLYIGTGDGGPSYDPFNTAQARGKLLGKILRIDPEKRGKHPYTVPKDNPFVGRNGRDEVYAYGLRNPWRFSFDRATGELTIGDVGQDRFEEVDIVPAGKANGANFGWSAYEGFGKFKGGVPRRATVKPVLAYPHGPGCAITGGYIVRDPRLARLKGREIVGRYLFGDYCTGKLFSMRPPTGNRGAGEDHPIGLRVPLLTSFGEDRAGHIYALSGKGPVYKLSATRHR